jgi:hypothetical protein
MDKYAEQIIKWYIGQFKHHKTFAAVLGDGRILLQGPAAGYVIPWDLDVGLHITDWTRTVPQLYSCQMQHSSRHISLLPDKVEHIMLGFRERKTQTFVNADPDIEDPVIRRVMHADLMRARGIKWYAESSAHHVVGYDTDGEPVAIFAQIVRR